MIGKMIEELYADGFFDRAAKEFEERERRNWRDRLEIFLAVGKKMEREKVPVVEFSLENGMHIKELSKFIDVKYKGYPHLTYSAD